VLFYLVEADLNLMVYKLKNMKNIEQKRNINKLIFRKGLLTIRRIIGITYFLLFGTTRYDMYNDSGFAKWEKDWLNGLFESGNNIN